LKRQSRVIAIADYSVEKTFVLRVPHRFLIGQPEQTAVQSVPRLPILREKDNGGARIAGPKTINPIFMRSGPDG